MTSIKAARPRGHYLFRVSSRVFLVSNRLPVTVSSGAEGFSVRPSSGGLATALSSVRQRSDTAWFGWPGDVGAWPAEQLSPILAEHRAVPIAISPEELRRYYDGFSNDVLWPLCHYLLDKVRLDAHDDWSAYQAINARFADAVADAWRPGDLVWVHDYQLALVPELVRKRCPGARIGFFLHVPFPAADVFRILPWREQVLRGLLGADVIGFHTANYAFHFAYACSQLLGLELTGDVIRYDGRPIRVAAFPIGIDADGFAARAQTEAVQQRTAALRAEAQGRVVLLSVDRFDYTKGLVRRLLALERLLTRLPELRDRLHVIQLAVPTRENVDAYADYRKTVNELVTRLNSSFGTATRNIVHLMHRSVDAVELSALYCAADVMLVTPLRDGMNLVAKEYVASRVDDTGVLVLSEFAGAAVELHEALQLNPYDLETFTEVIEDAITMSADEQRLRMSLLRKTVHTGSVDAWAQSFLGALEASPEHAAETTEPHLNEAMAQLRDAPSLVVFLDYDGTLVDFSPSPRTAMPGDDLLTLLERLTHRGGTVVHIVSGRARESLDDFLGGLALGLHAEHGLWSKKAPGAEWIARTPLPPAWLTPIREVIYGFVRRTDGAVLEIKAGALAFHYRATEPQLSHRRLNELRAALLAHPLADSFELLEGSRVLEVRQRGVSKGGIVADALQGLEAPAVLAIGDDRTDEALFAALPPTAVTVHVGPGQSVARFRVDGVDAVRALLTRLVEARDA